VKKKLDKTPPISQKVRDSSVRKERGGYYSQSPTPKPTFHSTSHTPRPERQTIFCAAPHQTPHPFCQNRESCSKNNLKKPKKNPPPCFYKTFCNQKKGVILYDVSYTLRKYSSLYAPKRFGR
jgi:hypothetical protein